MTRPELARTDAAVRAAKVDLARAKARLTAAEAESAAAHDAARTAFLRSVDASRADRDRVAALARRPS